ncbi:UDP-3-O-(3-hydroxymyristoyl)glucosamine N-acyltransferase, partial [Algibacter sp.]|nr:UDP-3-O-(3-hydroxymyristoyl)glucosamine N-acyltransferase [Algibacter sp.]
MKFTAQQIAGILEGDVVGNPDIEVSKLAKIEEGFEGALTFLANPKYTSHIYSTNASITIVNKTFKPEHSLKTTLIKVDDAYLAFSKILEYYNSVKLNKFGIEQPSFISDTSKYGDNVYIGAFSYIGVNVVLGDNVKVFPNAYIGDNVVIGDNTIVFSGAKVYSETSIGK